MKKETKNNPIYIDTNILVYLYTDQDNNKKNILSSALEQYTAKQIIIGTHILGELFQTLRKKFKASTNYTSQVYEHIDSIFTIVNTEQQWYLSASEIADITQFTYFDSLVLSSGMHAGCDTVYSEDFSHKQIVTYRNYQIQIINPFLH